MSEMFDLADFDHSGTLNTEEVAHLINQGIPKSFKQPIKRTPSH